MDMLWTAIDNKEDERSPFDKYAFGQVSENYRRVYEASEMRAYNKYQLLCDAVSGMTESYLIKVHDELSALNQ
jgi:dGTPase